MKINPFISPKLYTVMWYFQPFLLTNHTHTHILTHCYSYSASVNLGISALLCLHYTRAVLLLETHNKSSNAIICVLCSYLALNFPNQNSTWHKPDAHHFHHPAPPHAPTHTHIYTVCTICLLTCFA